MAVTKDSSRNIFWIDLGDAAVTEFVVFGLFVRADVLGLVKRPRVSALREELLKY
jgi:hypothetical protein